VFGVDIPFGGGDDEGSGGGDEDCPGRTWVFGLELRRDIDTGVEKPEAVKDGNEGPDPKPSRSLK
jgi:hypothetical protein